MTNLRKLLSVGVAACLLIAATGGQGGSSADAEPPDARFEAQITAFVHYRNSLLVSNNRAAARPTTLGAPAQARLDLAEEQLPKMESLMAELGEEYRNSQTEITVLETTPIDSTTTEVLYREFTTIFLKVQPGEEKPPEDPGYVEDYVATFTKGQGNNWRLDSVTLANEVLIPPMTEPIEGREVSSSAEEFYQKLADYDKALEGRDFGPDGPPDPLSPPADAAVPVEEQTAAASLGLGEGVVAAPPLILAAVDYQMTDIAAADAYGNAWWGPDNDDYNPDYKSYAPKDCANFVSQIMYAGGWSETGTHYWSGCDEDWCRILNGSGFLRDGVDGPDDSRSHDRGGLPLTGLSHRNTEPGPTLNET